MADQTPNIFPFMRFADADDALLKPERLGEPLQRGVHRDDQGAIRHAEMSLGAGTIMFGQGDPGDQGVYVAVEDADAHYERAKAAGAEITRDIEDTSYGAREYSSRDLAGHTWSFGTYRPEPAT